MQRNAVSVPWDGVRFRQFFQHHWHFSKMILNLTIVFWNRKNTKLNQIPKKRSFDKRDFLSSQFTNSQDCKLGCRVQLIAFEFAVQQIGNAPPSDEKEAKHVLQSDSPTFLLFSSQVGILSTYTLHVALCSEKAA